MDEYNRLLERARSMIPEDAFKRSGERFQVPEVQVMIQGNRTFWQNFQEIIMVLNRKGKEVLKYMAGQLATAGTVEGSTAVFNGAFPRSLIQEVLERYIEAYVRCPVCTRPDTTIVKDKNAYYLQCSACGAKTSIRPI